MERVFPLGGESADAERPARLDVERWENAAEGAGRFVQRRLAAEAQGVGLPTRAIWVRVRDRIHPYRHVLLAALVVAVLALGYVGFGAARGLSHLDRIYDSLELFQGKYDGRAGSADWQLNVARFLALAAFLYGLTLALGAMFRDQFDGLRAGVARDHVVVCGLGSVGRLAAINLRAAGHRVVAIELDEHHANIGRCRKAGVVVLKGDATTASALQAARVGRASHLVAATGSDARNAEVIATVRTLVRAGQRPLRCVVQVDDASLGDLLTDASFSVSEGDALTLEFFNVSERGAEEMLREFPLDGSRDPNPQVVIIGLGAFGTTLAEQIAFRWRQIGEGRRLILTVIDRHATRNVHHLLTRNPSIAEVCSIDERNWYVGEPDAGEPPQAPGGLDPLTGIAELGPVSCVYVCLGDDAASLTAGVTLHRANPSLRVVVRTSHRPSLGVLLAENAGAATAAGGLFSFDVLDYVCRKDVLLQGPHERLARAVHQRHVDSQRNRGGDAAESASARDWELLPETFREASRANADDIAAKLELIGYRIVRLTDWELPLVEFSDDEVEAMAKHEHDRWSAERRRAKWVFGETKDPVKKTHPMLVSWEDLEEEDREYDRRLVRAIPTMLHEIGYTVARSEPMPASASGAHGGAGGVGSTVEAVVESAAGTATTS